MNKEAQKIRAAYKKILSAPAINFPSSGPLDVTTDHGVYIILSPRNVVVHVGRTLRGREGLNQRLRNHLSGSSSFSRKYLIGKGAKLRSGYKYKFLAVKDARKRALLEAYAIGNLCPKHLGLGQQGNSEK